MENNKNWGVSLLWYESPEGFDTIENIFTAPQNVMLTFSNEEINDGTAKEAIFNSWVKKIQNIINLITSNKVNEIGFSNLKDDVQRGVQRCIGSQIDNWQQEGYFQTETDFNISIQGVSNVNKTGKVIKKLWDLLSPLAARELKGSGLFDPYPALALENVVAIGLPQATFEEGLSADKKQIINPNFQVNNLKRGDMQNRVYISPSIGETSIENYLETLNVNKVEINIFGQLVSLIDVEVLPITDQFIFDSVQSKLKIIAGIGFGSNDYKMFKVENDFSQMKDIALQAEVQLGIDTSQNTQIQFIIDSLASQTDTAVLQLIKPDGSPNLPLEAVDTVIIPMVSVPSSNPEALEFNDVDYTFVVKKNGVLSINLNSTYLNTDLGNSGIVIFKFWEMIGATPDPLGTNDILIKTSTFEISKNISVPMPTLFGEKIENLIAPNTKSFYITTAYDTTSGLSSTIELQEGSAEATLYGKIGDLLLFTNAIITYDPLQEALNPATGINSFELHKQYKTAIEVLQDKTQKFNSAGDIDAGPTFTMGATGQILYNTNTHLFADANGNNATFEISAGNNIKCFNHQVKQLGPATDETDAPTWEQVKDYVDNKGVIFEGTFVNEQLEMDLFGLMKTGRLYVIQIIAWGTADDIRSAGSQDSVVRIFRDGTITHNPTGSYIFINNKAATTYTSFLTRGKNSFYMSTQNVAPNDTGNAVLRYEFIWEDITSIVWETTGGNPTIQIKEV